MEQSILIIGGGLGGLSAAIHLAAQGRRVVLLEKNERVGGKLNILQAEGYTFDTGPSLLTMPWVLRDLLAVAGTTPAAEFTLTPLDPICRYRWPDGVQMDASSTLPRMLQEIERIEPGDLRGFLRFLEYSARIYQAVVGPFMVSPFDGLGDLISPRFVQDSLAIDPLRTVDQAVRSFFRSPYLQQLFNRYATYNGSSPYRAPATFNVIPYVEFSQGGWYVQGGMYEIARVLERIARRLGVEIQTNTTVQRIRLSQGRAVGVELSDGRALTGSTIIANADPGYTYRNLLPDRPQTAARISKLELSCSGFVLLLGIDRIYPDLAHHNIFFSHDYRSEFQAIFDLKVPPPDPTIYINVTSPLDPSHAPAGHMNLFVLINAPAHTGAINWQREAEGYGDLVIRKLERMGLAKLSQHVRFRQVISPADLAERYNAPGGAIYGLASNNPWTAFLRPPLRSRDTKGLYFVGGGTHPGGGIPLVLLSGGAVAKRVLHDNP
ncbi:MAG: phytoene desaturase family protein [Roseiflexaceae bacterium]